MKKFIKQKTSNSLNKMLWISIIVSLIIAITGTILIFLPEKSDRMIGIIAGVLFILSGLNNIYNYIVREYGKIYKYDIIFGLLELAIGALLICVPFTVTAFLTVCFGLYLITRGSNIITYGAWLKYGDDTSWVITLSTGLMLVLFGFLVIANPFSMITITRLVGMFLLISSVLNITITIMFKRRRDKIVTIFW